MKWYLKLADYGFCYCAARSLILLSPLMKEVKFNVNDYIKVKLNKSGIDLMRQNHNKIFGDFSSDLLDKYTFQEPEVDEKGYTKFQMWHFMDEFGHVGMGVFNGLRPYDTNIIICPK